MAGSGAKASDCCIFCVESCKNSVCAGACAFQTQTSHICAGTAPHYRNRNRCRPQSVGMLVHVYSCICLCVSIRAQTHRHSSSHTHTYTDTYTATWRHTHARTRMKNGAKQRVTHWSDKAMLSYTTDVHSVARRSDCLPAFALTGTGLVLDGVIVTVRDSRLFRHSRCRAPPGGDGRRHAERDRGRINRCAPLRTSIEISPLQPPSVAPVAVQE